MRAGGARPRTLCAIAAPFWRRVLADLIDLGLLAALTWALWSAGVIRPTSLPEQRYDWLDYAADLLANQRAHFRPGAVVVLTAGAVYAVIARTVAGGRTLGEWLLGLRLVGRDGEDAGPARAFVHVVGTVLGLSLLLFGYGWALVDRNRQGLAEHLSGSLLIVGRPRPDR